MAINTFVLGVSFYTTVACGVVQFLVGSFTGIKIQQSPIKENRWFGLAVSGGIAGFGLASTGYALFYHMIQHACDDPRFDPTLQTQRIA